MCKTPLHGFLQALPKCEHHMHLEGSLEPDLLFQLAAKNNIPLPSPSTNPAYASVASLKARYQRFENLDDFLGYYYTAMRTLINASDFEALTYAYLARAASKQNNVRHAEVFFDPQCHTERGVPLSTVVAGIGRARDRARADFPGFTCLVVMCVVRHHSPAAALAAFAEARDAGYFADGTLAGLGLDSSEAPFPPRIWDGVFEAAREAGVRRTAHAGEEGPSGYVVEALDLLLLKNAQRIDHGLRSVEDDALLARLAADHIMLTVCPLSNVRLRCIKSIADFPLRKLLDAGVRFSINSDDPAYFGGYVLDNYCALQEVFGLGVREWEGIAKGAVLGSWCGEERKGEILAEIERIVDEWAGILGEQ